MTLDSRKHRLFVEGPTDGVVINALVQIRLATDITKPRLIEVGRDDGGGGGFESVREQIEAALMTRKLERFGGVADRDGLDGKPDRWLSMKDLLAKNGLEVGEPKAEGMVVRTPWGARFGLWMMPDNLACGDLEHFIETLVPANATDWPWAQEASHKAHQEKGAPYKGVHAKKARLHTWHAWRDPPGKPCGTAMKAQHIGASSPAADAFVAWFQKLFVEP